MPTTATRPLSERSVTGLSSGGDFGGFVALDGSAKNSFFGKLRKPRLFVTEYLAQNFIRMLAHCRCRDRVRNRGFGEANGETHIRHPADRRMRDASDKAPFPCLRRTNGFTYRSHLPARHARPSHPRLPVSPWLLHKRFAKNLEEFVTPSNSIATCRERWIGCEIGAIEHLTH